MPQIDPKNGLLETLAPQAPITEEEVYFKSHIILKQNQINIIQNIIQFFQTIH